MSTKKGDDNDDTAQGTNKKTVVIVGAGFGGFSVYHTLRKNTKIEIIVVEPRECWYYKIGAPRAFVDEKYADSCLIPFSSMISSKNARLLKARLSKVDCQANKVYLDNDDAIDFDYLVLATGSSQGCILDQCNTVENDIVTSKDNALKEIAVVRDSIAKATNVLVVGGGLVGSELAFEIASKFPQINVTIVHSGPLLGVQSNHSDDMYPPTKFWEKYTAQAKSFKNATVLVNDRVDRPENVEDVDLNPRKYQSKSGVDIEADLTIWCIGEKINSASYENNDRLKMNAKGQLLVDEFMRCQGQSNIFATGDCSFVEGEGNRALHTEGRAKTIGANIGSMLDGKDCRAKYKADKKPATIVTLGPKHGMSQLPGGLTMGAWTTAKIKGGDMLLSRQLAKFK